MNKPSQPVMILRLLRKSKKGVPNHKLASYALKYTSVISELRKDGHDIRAERVYNRGRATGTWVYRLVDHEPKPDEYMIPWMEDAVEQLNEITIRRK